MGASVADRCVGRDLLDMHDAGHQRHDRLQVDLQGHVRRRRQSVQNDAGANRVEVCVREGVGRGAIGSRQ